VKLGDLVKVKECETLDVLHPLYTACQCFFCATKSNRIGFVAAVAPRDAFQVMFDTGMWRLDKFDVARGDVEVIRESR